MIKIRKTRKRSHRPIVADKISVRRPSKWEELTPREAMIIGRILCTQKMDPLERPLRAFLAINKIRVLHKNYAGRYLCRMHKELFQLDGPTLAKIAEPLRFILELPARAWRPDNVGNWKPKDPELSEVSFADYLVIDNTLQGVLHTGRMELLDSLRPILMKSRRRSPFMPEECHMAFVWLIALKRQLQRRFYHYLTIAPDTEEMQPVTSESLQDAADAQIRALTKGDVTKETEILNLNMYRAFAELNALAREAAEMKALSNS